MPAHTLHASADEWRQAIAAVDAAVDVVRRDAGTTPMPEHLDLLARVVRSLRPLGGDDVAALAHDFRDACVRVLESAEPAAPIASLGLVQDHLRRMLLRRAQGGMRDAA